MFHVDEDFNNSRKWKELFGVELQGRELIVVLRKTAWLSDMYSFQEGRFHKSNIRISNIIFSLMFSIGGDYNN